MIALVALLLAASPPPLRCGAVTRPGVAELGEDGVWRGSTVNLCRKIAEERSGAGAPIAFHDYDSFSALRAADRDDVAFLSGTDLRAVPLADRMRTGPVAAIDRQVVVVPAASPVREPANLAGKMICFIVGTRAEDALDAWVGRADVPIERLPFQERVEMLDAYDVGKCAALAEDAVEVPIGGENRVLDKALQETPILATTPQEAGDKWARTVAQVVGQARKQQPE